MSPTLRKYLHALEFSAAGAAIQGGYIPNWTGTQIINARLTTTTNNTSGLTAGSVTFYIVTDVFP